MLQSPWSVVTGLLEKVYGGLGKIHFAPGGPAPYAALSCAKKESEPTAMMLHPSVSSLSCYSLCADAMPLRLQTLADFWKSSGARDASPMMSSDITSSQVMS